MGVCFFEAQAYARWLTQNAGDRFKYRLPTEEEWERVAWGDTGFIFPWGNDFGPERCNHKGSGIGKPSRVTVYPNGISSYGCYDMAGNVWEWTGSFYSDKKSTYVLRGGAFDFGAVDCRCVVGSYFIIPNDRDFLMGFRCARIKL